MVRLSAKQANDVTVTVHPLMVNNKHDTHVKVSEMNFLHVLPTCWVCVLNLICT